VEPSPLVASKRLFNVQSDALWPEAVALLALCICLSQSTRMSDAETPNSCPEVVRSQPQSASMATSSQYYRSANPHSHCQNFQNNHHDQAYANFMGTWQDSNHTSYAGPSSVPLLHYPQAGLSSAFPRAHQPPPGSQAWNANYAQPNVQEWNTPVNDRVNDQAFAPRLGGSYDIAEGGASVQHSTPNAARQYPHQHHQQVSAAAHEQPLTSPDSAFRDTDRFTALRITSVSVKMSSCTLSFD